MATSPVCPGGQVVRAALCTHTHTHTCPLQELEAAIEMMNTYNAWWVLHAWALGH